MARVGLTFDGRNGTPTCLGTISLSLSELLPDDLQFGDPYTIHARLTNAFISCARCSMECTSRLPLHAPEMPCMQRVKLAHRSWLYSLLTYAGAELLYEFPCF
jgi:hypothetical protein